MLKVLYEDDEILVVIKPAGVESQAAKRFAPDMVSEVQKTPGYQQIMHTGEGTLCGSYPQTGQACVRRDGVRENETGGSGFK